MAFPARLLIALVAGLAGLAMFAIATQAGPGDRWGACLLGAFCVAVVLACFVEGRPRHFVGGLIASGIIAATAADLGQALMHGLSAAGRRSAGPVVDALLLLVAFGIPAAQYLRTTRFGFAPAPQALDEQVSIELDEAGVRIRAQDGSDRRWNQRFDWSKVVRVCFHDKGPDRSDLLYIQVTDRPEAIVVPVEAAGGPAFFGALVQRGLFPEELWRQAVGESAGRTHCWPPHDAAPAA